MNTKTRPYTLVRQTRPFSLHHAERERREKGLARQTRPPVITTYIIFMCSKSRVNTTPQDDAFVNHGTAAQNNQEGIYSLLQPPEDNNLVCVP